MGRGVHTPTEAAAVALVALRGADRDDPDALRQAVAEAVRELESSLQGTSHFTQSQAAALLGVSKTTLDNWVEKGLLSLQQVEGYKRPRVAAAPLLELAAEVRELRRMGQKRGLLAEALARLEREDPEWRQQFDELYGERARRPFNRDDYVSARPGSDWDPGD